MNGRVMKFGRVVGNGYFRRSCGSTGTTQKKPEWLNGHLSSPQGPAAPFLGGGASLNVRQRRALFRSRQRGWLEVDVLLGRWVSKNISSSLLATESGMNQLELILDQETPDLYRWITKQTSPPEYIEGEVFESIKNFVFGTGNIMDRE
mmetsp:Transcript_3676/g.6452  ORF Transcript_3676/g.6452 Transcript_3676/m.6452 type:complete len:148 (+) Transcript_3676:1443-1886(+)|eukprot:CAMPEP_0182448022 /NCGR_PEP_ID=MMETSP1172-20130603/22785_1 /TAXON_ID=708627 /ORGANISM="Timspurckia oligopyrenoides, Strain CCMP3278" /LENGTH=147 /DNA_ID=CAMNT_0024644719 /DNA_START=121 /DNA_END=564 /DNA_ORIENTATION=+